MKDTERALQRYQSINKELTAQNNRLKQELAGKCSDIIALNELLQAERSHSSHLKLKMTELLAHMSTDFVTFRSMIEKNAERVATFTDELYPRSSPFMQSTVLSDNRPTRSQSQQNSGCAGATTPTPGRQAKIGPRIKTPYGIVQQFSIWLSRLEASQNSSLTISPRPLTTSASLGSMTPTRPVLTNGDLITLGRPVRNLSARRSLDYEEVTTTVQPPNVTDSLGKFRQILFF